MSDIEQDMMEIAKKHLPAQVCGELKEQLESLKSLKQECDDLTSKNKWFQTRVEELEALKIDAKKVQQNKETILRDAIKLSEERKEFEMNKKVFELESKLEAQRTVAANAMMINSSLTRNVEYRKSVYGSQPAGVDQYGTVQQGDLSQDITTNVN